MILIVGGRSQGKRDFAAGALKIPGNEIADGRRILPENAYKYRCIADFQELIRKCADPVSFTENLCRTFPDCVIIMDEVGCGIVPMEKSDRVWRENVGRCGCIIASHASCVVRMVCGIPTVIKGELP